MNPYIGLDAEFLLVARDSLLKWQRETQPGSLRWQLVQNQIENCEAAALFLPMPAKVGVVVAEWIGNPDDETVEVALFERERIGAGLEWGTPVLRFKIDDDAYEGLTYSLAGVEWRHQGFGADMLCGACSLVDPTYRATIPAAEAIVEQILAEWEVARRDADADSAAEAMLDDWGTR